MAFKKEMETLIESLKKKIPLIFENETYLNKKKEVVERYRNKQAEMFREFEKKVNKEGFTLVQIQMGPYSRPGIFPMVEGNPVNIEQLETMVEEGKFTKEDLERMKAKQTELVNELETIFKETRKSEKEIKEELTALDNEVISPVVKDSISDIKERFNYEKVHHYLDEVQEDILGQSESVSREGRTSSLSDSGAGLSPAGRFLHRILGQCPGGQFRDQGRSDHRGDHAQLPKSFRDH